MRDRVRRVEAPVGAIDVVGTGGGGSRPFKISTPHGLPADGVAMRTVEPGRLGLADAPTSALAGGTAEENAAMIEALFAGETGARRDVVLLNAGAAFVAAGRATDVAGGVEMARSVVDSAAPRQLIDRLRAMRRAHEAEGVPA